MARLWPRAAFAFAAMLCLAPAAFAQSIDYGPIQRDPTPESVAAVLEQMPESTTTGEHHIELSYCTTTPGVVLPPDIRARYPREITVVLQWQYWNLTRVGDIIRVTVSFGGEPAHIAIPLRALTHFSAPGDDVSVRLRSGEDSEERCRDAGGSI